MIDWIAGNPLWDEFRDLDLRLAQIDLGEDSSVPQVRINKVAAARNAAKARVLEDKDLLAALRAAVATESRPYERDLLGELLRLPVEEVWELGIPGLLEDLRVDVHPDEVDVQPAFYITSHDPFYPVDDLEVGPYAPEGLLDPEDQDFRELQRVGGVPTRVPGVDIPDTVFLLQVDLRALRVQHRQIDAAAEVFDSGALPGEGMVQLFHTTRGDSVSEPHRPGGGVTVLYLSEEQLTRRYVEGTEDPDYPVKQVTTTFLPTFAHTPLASPASSVRIEELQQESDTIATMYGGIEVSTDPFAPNAPAWTRVLGLPHYAHGLEDGDRAVLDQQLPLTSPGDRHVLLFNLSSDSEYDQVFGDEGRLEIWLRASDLTKARFDDVVSFWRLT